MEDKRMVETSGEVEHSNLGNAISDAIYNATGAGVPLSEALSIVVAVAADYARAEYGNFALEPLAEIVMERGQRPLPSVVQ